jgi:predicted MPP superfamily phosphohydrolase
MRSFFVVLMAIGTVFSLAQWLMYRTVFPCLSSRWTILLFLVPVFVFTLINGYMNVLPRFITRALAWAGGLYFAFFYYSIILLVLFLVVTLLGKIFAVPSLAPYFVKGAVVFILVLLVGGCWNATHPVYREETFTTDKPLAKPLKIAFFADTHLGVLFGKDFSEHLIEKVNAAKPDLVLIGGDMVDNDLYFVLHEGSLEPWKDIKAPLGVYAVYGNHDVMRGTSGPEKTYLESLHINMVCNDTVKIGDNIILTGLDDFSRSRNTYDFAPASSDKLSLFMEHQPRSLEKAAAKGYDLSFAGHTHAGQFYPNREITKRLYSLDYGSKFFSQMLATVTNGYGLWGVPIRVGPSPEIVVITVKNK